MFEIYLLESFYFLNKDRIRFCFYGTNQPVLNFNLNNSNSFYDSIYHTLLPGSPNYIYINPFDGCVKLSSVFNLQENPNKFIQYSVNIINFYKNL